MVRFFTWIATHVRLAVQIAFTLLTNGYMAGFTKGTIFTGPTKYACVPGLNCYSCPGALASCPIGALQAVLGSRDYKFTFYIAGFLLATGALLGRLVCGWLCPFGLVQDLVFKIPFVKKLRALPGDKWLKFLKYGILVGFVILLPSLAVDIIGQGQPWFCEYICPSGTLMAGLPLVAANPGLQQAAGGLFVWKVSLLAGLIILSIAVYRPFCRYVCPLGAVYGLFNKVSLYRLQVDESKCTGCGACESACKLDIKVFENPNSAECIRCGACKKACPQGAIESTFETWIRAKKHSEGNET